MRVLHVEPAAYGAEARRVLERVAEVDYVECADHVALVAAAGHAPYGAIFGRLGLAIDRHVIAAAPSLRFIVTPTTGLDHIDIEAAESAGIRVLSLRGETAFLETIRSTAEHTFALLLALVRHIPEVHGEVLEGRWLRGAPGRLDELDGKTLGIVGCGRLGRMMAGYGVAFGMTVIAHDTDRTAIDRVPGVKAVELAELLRRSDIVSVHLPLNADTRGYLDVTRLKPGAILVNTARGELVDERSLLIALKSGHLAGAALDVLDGDGRWDGAVPADHPLVRYARTHHNLLLTPHVGGFGTQSLERARQFIAQKFVDALSTQETV